MKIQAAVIHEKDGPFRIEDVELAPPKAGEILVKIVASGVCHTDEVVQHQMIPVPLPAVLGHEGSGVVQEVGECVTEFRPGDRVGFSFGYCGCCESCRSAHPHACKDFNAINFGGVMSDGTRRLSQNGREVSSFFGQSSFATYAVVHQNSAVKVEDDIDLALVGPLGCGIQTGAGAVLNRLRPAFGSTLVVFGCGTVGMSAIMAARIAGCAQIIAVSGTPSSLELARELGATHGINRKETDDVVARVKEITRGGAHYAIDTTGVPAIIKKALACLRFMGTAVVLGVAGDMTINVMNELMGEAKSLIGVVEGDSVPKVFIPQLLDYYRAGRFPFDRLVTWYDFADINQAFADSHNGKVIKAVLRMN